MADTSDVERILNRVRQQEDLMDQMAAAFEQIGIEEAQPGDPRADFAQAMSGWKRQQEPWARLSAGLAWSAVKDARLHLSWPGYTYLYRQMEEETLKALAGQLARQIGRLEAAVTGNTDPARGWGDPHTW